MIRLEGVTKRYSTTERDTVTALFDINPTVESGEMVAITGRSGSGTGTLMNVLSYLDLPSGGRYLLDGIDVATLSKRASAEVSGQKVGCVLHSFDLIPNVSVRENVEPRASARVARCRSAHCGARIVDELFVPVGTEEFGPALRRIERSRAQGVLLASPASKGSRCWLG